MGGSLLFLEWLPRVFLIGVSRSIEELRRFIGVWVVGALCAGEGSGLKSGISSRTSSGVAQGEWWGVDPSTPLMSMGSSAARDVGKQDE